MAIEHIRHRLGTAVQFVDIFTSKPVDLPLDVRADTLPIVPGMPGIPWRAARGPNDSTYRFLVNNDTVMPIGDIPVTVIAPGKEYVDFEPFAVALPRPFAAHPPTPARSDFLVQHPLWPTRSLGLPAGRNRHRRALRQRRRDADRAPQGHHLARRPADAAVALHVLDRRRRARLSASEPENRDRRRHRAGRVAPDRRTKLPPAYVAAVAPTQMTTDTGTLLAVPFPIRLGRVTNLTITLP